VSGRFFRRSHAVLAALAGLALCGAATVAVVATTGGTASAISGYYLILSADSSSLNLDVSGASTAPGGRVTQWYSNGGANQNWSVPDIGLSGVIQNQNSGMCLTTDGVAGDRLYQKLCLQRMFPYQQRHVSSPSSNIVTLYNPAFGLAVDVYNDSDSAGAHIDGWYPNGQPNQFSEFEG
jgi:Ricin-type beta-trefoil lectin domain-like